MRCFFPTGEHLENCREAQPTAARTVVTLHEVRVARGYCLLRRCLCGVAVHRSEDRRAVSLLFRGWFRGFFCVGSSQWLRSAASIPDWEMIY